MKRIIAILLIPVACAFSIRSKDSQASGPGASSLPLDVQVSPLSDPDPHDQPRIAVSPIDDRVVVAVSNVVVGGAAGSGTGRVAYYYSSDGGVTWRSALLSLQTSDKTFDLAYDPAIASDAVGNFYVA